MTNPSSTAPRPYNGCSILLMVIATIIGLFLYYDSEYASYHRVTHNWDRQWSFKPSEPYMTPRTEQDIIDIVVRAKNSGQRVRVVGGGHSWSDIAKPVNFQMSLMPYYNRVLSINKEKYQITVEGGARLRDIISVLATHNMSMSMLGSINVQAIAGAIMTGTHGTGIRARSLANSIVDMRLVTATGDVLYCSNTSNAHLWDAVRLSLGALGIVSTVTLQVEPLFNLHSHEYPLSRAQLFGPVLTPSLRPVTPFQLDGGVVESLPYNETALMASSQFFDILYHNEHVKFWSFPHTNHTHVYTFNRSPEPEHEGEPLWLLEALTYPMELLSYIGTWCPSCVPSINALVQSIGFPPKQRVARSDHVFNIPHRIPRHAEAEWSVPVQYAADAFNTILSLIDTNYPHVTVNFIIEVRFVAADRLWLSPDYERTSCRITLLITNGDIVMRDRYFGMVEQELVTRYDARPHWAKSFTLDHKQLIRVIPRLHDFIQLRDQMDPYGMFANAYLDRVLGVAPQSTPVLMVA